METAIRVIIAEDKPMLREGFVLMLRDYNIATIGQASNGKELLELLKVLTPDIVLLDLNMPIMDGSKAYHELRELYPNQKVIILSGFNESVLIEDYLKRGVDGYITKDEVTGDAKRFSDYIRRVYFGAKQISQNADNKQLKFTEIQKDIMQLDGSGTQKNDISQITGLTKDAVNKQKRKIMEKLGVYTISGYYLRLASSGFGFLRMPAKKNNPNKK